MISDQTLSALKEWFKNYSTSFLRGEPEFDRNINLKIAHSLRVASMMNDLTAHEKLSDQDKKRAEIMALFHDVGRFEQYEQYRTFADRKSVSHAHLGVDVLKKHDTFAVLDDAERNLIYSAIEYHSVKDLPEYESAECLLFSRLLRDADKIDIYKIVSEYYTSDEENETIGLDLPDDNTACDKIIDSILKRESVDHKHMKSLNDFKLLQMAWVHDLNFEFSKQIVKDNNYLDIIHSTMPALPSIEKAYRFLKYES